MPEKDAYRIQDRQAEDTLNVSETILRSCRGKNPEQLTAGSHICWNRKNCAYLSL